MYRKGLYAVFVLAALVLCCFDFNRNVVPRAGAQGPGPLPSPTPQLALTSPVSGFSQPLGIVNAGDGSNRLFVVEKTGAIRIVKNGTVVGTPFLDIHTLITTDSERGLLGLAFPPEFATKQHFYIYYTDTSGNIRIARYRVSAGNADVADANSEQVVITIPHPTNSNHNGGDLAFGPQDGFLYAGTGDGGAGNDPPNNSQNPSQLLGKILRLDVEGGSPATYNVPSSNPFATSTTLRHEIWAYGVRNPWRFTFDRQTHDLYIADVGQGAVEEVDFQPAADAGGENYGWRVWEGGSCTGLGPAACTTDGYTFPVIQYTHVAGRCAITGGYVYRGATFPRMQGIYFYGDLCTGEIWGTKRDGSGAWVNSLLLDTPLTNLSTFGEDEAGNLYVADLGAGTIYSITDATPPPTVSVGDASVTEGNSGQTAATFAVTLSRSPDSAVSVSYHTTDGTANAPGDYQSASGSVVINPGQTSANIVVQVNGDTLFEPDETFNVNLDGVTGPATLSDAQGLGTILNDDAAPTPTPSPSPSPTPSPSPSGSPAAVHFDSATISAGEQSGSVTILVTRSGDTGPALSVDYATSDGTASSRSDYTPAFGTLHFAPGDTTASFKVLLTNDDTHEGNETINLTLSNLTGDGSLASPTSAVLNILDDDATTSAANPIDRSDFFVTQHYHDFLNREPDPSGLQFWTNNIESCGADAGCREAKRVDTSAAFFLSIEFQETGFFVYRVHKAAFGDLAGLPVPVRFDEFLRGTQEIGQDVVVGQGDWQTRLEQNKQKFADEFVARADFVARYPASQTASQYVSALAANAPGALTQAEQDDLAARLANGLETRATVLRRVAEDADFKAAEFDRAFVLMQYFGYLRRDPDSAPDADFAGYNFWLSKLEQFGGDFRAAEMVRAFISSTEYRKRFGP